MNDKSKNKIISIIIISIFISNLIIINIKPINSYSISERRTLAELPQFTSENIGSGTYMKNYESYLLDQFPFRDSLRKIKAMNELYLFSKSDYNNLYFFNGHLCKIEYPLNEKMINYAISKFENIYTKYLKEKNNTPYMVVIPDKNYYLAQENNYLSMDYNYFYEYVRNKAPFMNHIEIRDTLSVDDYYYTDPHWNQVKILDTAQKIGKEMNMDLADKECYTLKTISNPFFGAYYHQYTLPVECDKISYLTNSIIEQCSVTIYDNNSSTQGVVYNLEKAQGSDPYEMFLEGSKDIIEINNPNSNNNKKLIIFRDSFGSSIAPLFISSYSTITLIDIRYINSNSIDEYVSFDNSDVLFLYNTTLLNNSITLK